MTKVVKIGNFQTGSFGLRLGGNRRGDEIMAVWACGHTKPGMNLPEARERCLHTSRSRARACRGAR